MDATTATWAFRARAYKSRTAIVIHTFWEGAVLHREKVHMVTDSRSCRLASIRVSSCSSLLSNSTMPRRSTRVVTKSITSSNSQDLEVDSSLSSHNDNQFEGNHLDDVDEESTNKTLKKRKQKSTAKQADSNASQKAKHFRGIRGKLRQLP